jgi:hypothetical protein
MSYLGKPVGYLQGDYACSTFRVDMGKGEKVKGFILDNNFYLVSNMGYCL